MAYPFTHHFKNYWPSEQWCVNQASKPCSRKTIGCIKTIVIALVKILVLLQPLQGSDFSYRLPNDEFRSEKLPEGVVQKLEGGRLLVMLRRACFDLCLGLVNKKEAA